MCSWICRNMCWNVSLVPSPTYSWHTNKHKQTLLSHLLIDWTRDRNISPNSSDQLATCKDYTRPIFTKDSDGYFFDWNLTNMILFPTSLEHNVLNPFICSIKDYTHIYICSTWRSAFRCSGRNSSGPKVFDAVWVVSCGLILTEIWAAIMERFFNLENLGCWWLLPLWIILFSTGVAPKVHANSKPDVFNNRGPPQKPWPAKRPVTSCTFRRTHGRSAETHPNMYSFNLERLKSNMAAVMPEAI